MYIRISYVDPDGFTGNDIRAIGKSGQLFYCFKTAQLWIVNRDFYKILANLTKTGYLMNMGV